MSSLAAIRDAIEATLRSQIAALHVYDTVPDATNLPAVVVQPVEADFDVAMGRGTDTWEFDLFVLVQRAEPGLGQDQLDGFITGAGAQSIRQAVFTNRGLGLSDVDAHVARMSGYGGSHQSAGVDHIGAVLRLVVHTRGTA